MVFQPQCIAPADEIIGVKARLALIDAKQVIQTLNDGSVIKIVLSGEVLMALLPDQEH